MPHRRSPLARLGACLRGEFGPRTDWVDVVAIANDYLVGPSLYRELCRSERRDPVDPEAMAYLGRLHAANLERNAALRRQIVEVAEAMTAEGLEPLLIKGAALLALPGDPAAETRMIGDIDLVAGPERAEMDGVLRRLGYAVVDGTARGHSAGTYWRGYSAGGIDLHARLPVRMAPVIFEADLAARTERVRLGDAVVRVPDATLHVALNIAHEMLHDQGLYTGLTEVRYVLELRDVVCRSQRPIDWDWLARKCENPAFALALELQARMARELLGFDPFPGVARSRRGDLLHRRRLLKARLDAIGRLEWRVVSRLMRMRRPSVPPILA